MLNPRLVVCRPDNLKGLHSNCLNKVLLSVVGRWGERDTNTHMAFGVNKQCMILYLLISDTSWSLISGIRTCGCAIWFRTHVAWLCHLYCWPFYSFSELRWRWGSYSHWHWMEIRQLMTLDETQRPAISSAANSKIGACSLIASAEKSQDTDIKYSLVSRFKLLGFNWQSRWRCG